MEVRGDSSSPLAIFGNSILRHFKGDLGEIPYQVLLKGGIYIYLLTNDFNSTLKTLRRQDDGSSYRS